MDEREPDFEFDFFPDHPADMAETDEELLWEESSPDQPRRRAPAASPPADVVKRRRVVASVAVGLLLLIILIVVLTSGGGGGGDAYRNYVNDVSPVASDSQQAGTALTGLTGKTASSKLDALIGQTMQDISRLQALTPPKELTSQHAQALAALDLRLLGLQQLRESVSQSSGAGGSTDAAVGSLVASDRIWDGSVRTPANAVLQARGLGGIFPASTFVGDRSALVKKLDALSGSSATSPTGAVLTLGAKGQDVTAWQNGLNRWLQATGSTLTPLTVDGTFGPGTQQLTAALQTNQGLSPDGVVGPSTRQALQNALKAAKGTTGTAGTSTASTMKLGDTGQDIVTWQQQLNRWLQKTSPSQPQLSTDGSFGAATQTATEQLQTAAGLTPTGEVDAQTRQALTSALANVSPNRG
jgi:peptidoglycan hydrolase-like protein with peptidoglycan-binding domain